MSVPGVNPAPTSAPVATASPDTVGATPAQARTAFMDRAAKAVWSFITAFALAMANAVIPTLIDGRFPTSVEWITAFGLGLAGAYGVAQAVYSVTNKPETWGTDA